MLLWLGFREVGRNFSAAKIGACEDGGAPNYLAKNQIRFLPAQGSCPVLSCR